MVEDKPQSKEMAPDLAMRQLREHAYRNTDCILMQDAADTIEGLKERVEELQKQISEMTAGEAGLSTEEIMAFREDRYLTIDTQRLMDDALRAWLKLGRQRRQGGESDG
jgi:hypothetical protein